MLFSIHCCAPVSELPIAPNETAWRELTPAPSAVGHAPFIARGRKQGGSLPVAAVFLVVLAAAVIGGLGNWAKTKALNRASNACNMTYSSPKFVPLAVAGYPGRGEETAGEKPGYGYRLMRYIDRKLPAADRADPSKPRGVPVLFVPGHLGKYDQVCVFFLGKGGGACLGSMLGGCLSYACVPFCIVLVAVVRLGRKRESPPAVRG